MCTCTNFVICHLFPPPFFFFSCRISFCFALALYFSSFPGYDIWVIEGAPGVIVCFTITIASLLH